MASVPPLNARFARAFVDPMDPPAFTEDVPTDTVSPCAPAAAAFTV